ncbi:MAG: hypothetical protein WB053_09040 [Nitrososphaeraceae archaeon]
MVQILRELVKGSVVRGKRKKEGRHNSGIDNFRATDGKISKGSEYRKNDYISTSLGSPILSFWQQQLFSMNWSEFFKEYLEYAKRMARINEELIKRSLRVTQLFIELSDNAQHLNDLYKESIEITEEAYKNWLNVNFDFWNKNEISTSTAKKNDTYSEKMKAKNRNANLTREEQKSINSMFKDSLTFD